LDGLSCRCHVFFPISPLSALSTHSCTFEEDLCGWTLGTEGELDWLTNSGPTDAPDTGPPGDHTTGTGQLWGPGVKPLYVTWG